MSEPSCRIEVHITSRAGHDAIGGWDGGALRVRVAAPPIENRANRALEALLAQKLGLPKLRVQVVQGATSRRKLVAIAGMTQAEVRTALAENASAKPL